MQNRSKVLIGLLVLLLLLLIFSYRIFYPRHNLNNMLTVDFGESLSELRSDLDLLGVSTSYPTARILFRVNGSKLQAGTYDFSKSVSLSTIMKSVANGLNTVPATEFVIPEGFSNQKILDRISEITAKDESLSIDINVFADLIKDDEGYLFPDTYYIYPETTAEDLYRIMIDNYKKQTESFTPALSRDEVIIASIIEREVSNDEDRSLVSDILWRRLEIGMRLQVDASLDYYLDKASDEITKSELESDHPYNTYRRDGLPPTPIANPGLASLKAARNPTPNQYLFYLSADDGTTYYASDLEGHKQNRELYL